MKKEIDINEKNLKRIEEYIEKGRFEDLDEFLNKSAKLLLYAEDKKDEFGMILPKKPSTQNP